ncbi:MAG: HD domain-containing protein [Desulfobacterales bacterium]|nr:HD domain-containing protein [Desulfobacterales bacterium]MDD4071300.1 HD domain-containing protein [Desulfobacterales bacterium]MDD4393016.1 HD domain-containing protein [Desulfobacterales bacterium]
MNPADNAITRPADSGTEGCVETGHMPEADSKPPLDQIKTIASRLFEGARGSHDWDHTLRVCRLCEHIGPAEAADMDTLMIAAYLHDIGRCYQDRSEGAVCHADKGAQMAWPLIRRLALSKEQKLNIIHCIRSHRFRGSHAPETTEAKVLFDADKLDSIGAIGVARAYLFAGEIGAKLHNPDIPPEDARAYSADDTGYREFKVKLCNIKNRILTREGRKLADERHEFMEAFFNRFLKEYEGIR